MTDTPNNQASNNNGTNNDEATVNDSEDVRPPVSQVRGGFQTRFGAGAIPAEKSKDFAGSTRRLFAMMRPQRRSLMVVLAATLTSVTLAVIGPKVLGHATDILVEGLTSTSGGVDVGRLRNVLYIVVALYVVSSLLAWLQAYLLAGVVQRTMYRLRSDVEDKLHRLTLGYVDSQPRGDLLSRVTNDIDNVAQSLQQSLSQLLTAALTVIGVVAMMFVISPILALVALATIPSSLLIVQQVAKRSKKRFVAQWAHTGALNGQVEEAFTGHALVKVFGQQAAFEAKFRNTNEQLFQASFSAQFLAGSIQPAMMFLGNLNFVAVAVIGGLRVSSGAMSLGDIQAFIQYSRQFTQPLTQLASMMNVFQSGIASAERVFDLLDVPEQTPDPLNALIDDRPRGRVEFDHVGFSYNKSVPLIHDLSLVAEPGRTIAIVGPTGAGKTTLVNLIMRFYELDAGTITLDGIDIAQMRRSELRSNIGMVLQDTWLFEGTIRDNIVYGNPQATDQQIGDAARATYVDRFVHSLPDGYDTVVDDEGGMISAGEKQLITIARAFLADPTILILDEATSSVDTRTEVLIQRAMAALRSQRTSFVIAHRLSTIRDADLILVMDAGTIVEQGTHAQLLASGGAYATLYNAQFTGPVTAES
jgi:ATP-binding cassette, subfamily B, multidrug efflux pump